MHTIPKTRNGEFIAMLADKLNTEPKYVDNGENLRFSPVYRFYCGPLPRNRKKSSRDPKRRSFWDRRCGLRGQGPRKA